MILLSWAALADYLQEHPNGFWPWLSTFRTAVRACPQNPKMDCLSLTLPLLQTQPQHFCILRQCKLQENKRIPKTGLWKYQPEHVHWHSKKYISAKVTIMVFWDTSPTLPLLPGTYMKAHWSKGWGTGQGVNSSSSWKHLCFFFFV